MKARTRLDVQHLESRWCPALTATFKSGALAISGSADNGSISVLQSNATPGTITVLDGAATVGASPYSGVTSIRLNLTSANDSVNVDLGGKAFAGSIYANLGAGTNTLNVGNGEATRLSVVAGNDDDVVTLGDGTASLKLNYADLVLHSGMDTVTIKSGVAVSSRFSSFYANDVSLDSGSTVGQALIRGGSGGNTIDVAGDVTGNLVVDAFFLWGGSSDATSFDFSGKCDGHVACYGSNLDDTVTISGTIGKSLGIAGLQGADNIAVSGFVTGATVIDSGSGNDTVDLSGTYTGKTTINTGSGDDVLNIGASAKFLSLASVNMGAGNDSATLNNAASFTTLVINGGTGTNSFTGNKAAPGLTLVNF